MAKRNEKLYGILCEFGRICGGIMYGEISFTFNGDPLMCALKPGHPGDIMDDIVSMVYAKVDEDPVVSLPTVKEGLSNFKAFKKCFGVKELAAPIKKLTAYVKDLESTSRVKRKKIGEKVIVELENPKFDHWAATTCGPCCAAQGTIDKACGKAGDVYVYYRRENRAETVFAAYSAEGVPPIEDSESIQKFPRIAEYSTLRDAKKSPYGPAFAALWQFVKEQKAARR